MSDLVLIILGAGGGLAITLIVWLMRRPQMGQGVQGEGFTLIQNQINELTRVIDQKVGEATKETSEATRHQFSESAQIIRDVTEGLTKLDETNRQAISFADQLQSLQDILKNP